MQLEVIQTTRKIHKTSIGWTDFAVGSPFVFRDKATKALIRNACVKCSTGCTSCYAETIGLRFKTGRAYTKAEMERLECHVDKGVIDSILRFKPRGPYRGGTTKPKVFLGDCTDLFGEWVPFEALDRVFAAMALRTDVIWQILTKRPERMAAYFKDPELVNVRAAEIAEATFYEHPKLGGWGTVYNNGDPWPHIWLGASVENQATAEARVKHLFKCQAPVLFLSVEPLLSDVDLCHAFGCGCTGLTATDKGYPQFDFVCGLCDEGEKPPISWVIVGVESNGPRVGRLPGKSEAKYWDAAASIVKQCRDAGVPCFHKQAPAGGLVSHEMDEWPEPMRVREFPEDRRLKATSK